MKHSARPSISTVRAAPATPRARVAAEPSLWRNRSWTALAVGILATLLLVLGGTPAPAEAPSFVVIVNADNPMQSIGTEDLSRIFMKKTKKWEDDTPILPVDLGGSADARKDFSRSVHGRSATAIKNHWQRRVFSGRGTPPPELESDAAVVMYVRYKRGAIGYVSADTELTGVHALAVKP